MIAISVLIPCFNAQSTIRETVLSALAETTLEIEVRVLDDGSTDASREVLAAIDDPRLHLGAQANAGASVTRNRLIDAARGIAIQFLDADDLLAPGALQAKWARLQSSAAAAVYSSWQRFRDAAGEREILSTHREPWPAIHHDPEIAAFGRFWAPPVAWLYRADVIRQLGGFRVDLPVIQDARLIQDLALSGAEMAHVDELLALYRDPGPQSLSRRNRVQFLRDCALNASQIESIWRARPDGLSPARGAALAACYAMVCRGQLLADPAEFERNFARLQAVDAQGVQRWPRLAARLSRWVGVRRAGAVLRWLRRPAESA
jgi:glycosyltransferase involved in cell wall biosynthesis